MAGIAWLIVLSFGAEWIMLFVIDYKLDKIEQKLEGKTE